jgi:hypothetical protein
VSFVRDLSAIGWDRLGQVTESSPPTAPATDRSFGHIARDGRRSVKGACSGTALSLRCAPDPSLSVHHGDVAGPYRRDILMSGSRTVCRRARSGFRTRCQRQGVARCGSKEARAPRTLKSDMPTSVVVSAEGKEQRWQ